DVPANATERVATRIGPGPVRDVLATLLNGTAFNYVMVGSASNPEGLSTLLLTPKPAGGASNAGGEAVAYQPPQQLVIPQPAPVPGAGPGGTVAQQVANGDDEADADEKDDEDADDQAQQEGQANTDGSQDVSQPTPPRTAEQILEMMRQHQQMPPGRTAPPPTPQLPTQPPDINQD